MLRLMFYLPRLLIYLLRQIAFLFLLLNLSRIEMEEKIHKQSTAVVHFNLFLLSVSPHLQSPKDPRQAVLASVSARLVRAGQVGVCDRMRRVFFPAAAVVYSVLLDGV